MDYWVTTVQKHEFTKINVLISTTNTDSSLLQCHPVSLCEQLLTFWRTSFSKALRTSDTITQHDISEDLNHLQYHCKTLKSNTITTVLLTYVT